MLYAKGKVLFIHIPKTGGRNAAHLIQHQGSLSNVTSFVSHATAKGLQPWIEDFDSVFKCAFVRNTWDWLASLYFQIRENPEHPDYFRVLKMDFETYIKWLIYIRRTRPKDTPVFGDTVWIYKLEQTGAYPYYPSFTEYLTNKGEVLVDYIGFTHEFQRSMDDICDKLGYDRVETEHKNKNKGSDYTKYYTKESENLVYENFREDIEWFNWEFGGNIND